MFLPSLSSEAARQPESEGRITNGKLRKLNFKGMTNAFACLIALSFCFLAIFLYLFWFKSKCQQGKSLTSAWKVLCLLSHRDTNEMQKALCPWPRGLTINFTFMELMRSVFLNNLPFNRWCIFLNHCSSELFLLHIKLVLDFQTSRAIVILFHLWLLPHWRPLRVRHLPVGQVIQSSAAPG